MLTDFLSYHNDELVFGNSEIGLKTLGPYAKDYAGPMYLYHLDFIESRCQKYRNGLGQVRALPTSNIYYAMKANSHPKILHLLAKTGIGIDVVSGGELTAAKAAGVVPDKIIFSGVGKTKSEIELAVQIGIRQINVESLPELIRIAEITKSLRKNMPVVLRINPNIDIKTHPHIATGLRDNKFGIEATDLASAINILQQNHQLKLKGVSMHLGSQMKELQAFRLALVGLRLLFLQLRHEFPTCNCFDVGGGLGIFYEKMDLQNELNLVQEYWKIVDDILGDLLLEIQSEPGRWLVGHAGLYMTQVQYVKKTSFKNFLILDGGMNHLARPVLYDAYHGIWPLYGNKGSEKIEYDVVGPICESADFFARSRVLPEFKADDFLIIADVGAYGYSMANRYNLQALPQEICL